MQGFFAKELVEFATRELGGDAVRAAAPELAWPVDPTVPVSAERFRAMAAGLAAAAGEPAGLWLRRFGRELFGRLAVLHAVFFVGVDSGFEFLAGFERQVHEELRRLRGDLAPPRMDAVRAGPDRLELRYRSDRALADLAHGMIEGCLAHFGDRATVRRESDGGGVRFVLERAPAG